MKKRFFSIIIAAALLCACIPSGCGEAELPPEQGTEQVYSQRMRLFLRLVDEIEPPITLALEADLDAAAIVYAALDEGEKGDSAVAQRKTALDGYRQEFDALKAQAEREKEEKAEKERVDAFLAATDLVPAADALTLSDRAAIDRAKELYAELSDPSKAEKRVADAYAALVKADERLTEMEETAHEEAVRTAANSFIEGVENLGEITLDSGVAITELLHIYESFDEEIKSFAGVQEAKEKLDVADAEYRALVNERDKEEFLGLVGEIKEPVGLESESAISRAERAYERLSGEVKSDEEVVAAYEKLTDARARYREIFLQAENEKAQKFIEAAKQVPTDLENVGMDWFNALRAASEAYAALAPETQARTDAEFTEAFNRWNNAQKAFDEKGYRQIPMENPILQTSGDRPSFIVLQYDERMFNTLFSFYGVTDKAALAEQCVAWLDVYVDGVFIAKGELNLAGIGHIIYSSEVLSVLKTLSAEDPAIVSGADFSFAIHFSDREDRFIPSDMTNRLEIPKAQNYTW